MKSAIKNFLWQMLAEKGLISSKRCIASSGMATLIFLTIHEQLTGKTVDAHVYDMLVLVILGAAGITAFEKVKDMVTKAKEAAAQPVKMPNFQIPPIPDEQTANA